LDRFVKPLVSCPLLLDSASYYPDTEDLLQNKDAREYWLQCFEDATNQVANGPISKFTHENRIYRCLT